MIKLFITTFKIGDIKSEITDGVGFAELEIDGSRIVYIKSFGDTLSVYSEGDK